MVADLCHMMTGQVLRSSMAWCCLVANLQVWSGGLCDKGSAGHHLERRHQVLSAPWRTDS